MYFVIFFRKINCELDPLKIKSPCFQIILAQLLFKGIPDEETASVFRTALSRLSNRKYIKQSTREETVINHCVLRYKS